MFKNFSSLLMPTAFLPRTWKPGRQVCKTVRGRHRKKGKKKAVTGCIMQHSPCQLTVGIVLAPFHFAAHSHPPATGYLTTLPQYAQQVVLFIFIPSAYKSKLLTLPDKNKAGLCPAYCFCCDPVGIRTQDPQLRRLLLYPAELPDLSRFNLKRMQI